MKLSKKQKKIAIIALTGLFLVLASALFYFLFLKKGPQELWYNSSWSYRKSINVETPSEYRGITEDVLIEIDTAQLIEENKLTLNCKDLRFVDEDNSTTLRHWIESGCNTSDTQIWVEMTLPNASEKTFYMYYGNELATDGQEDWLGEFISMSTQECTDGWSYRERFEGRFPIGADVFGKSGGSDSHLHQLFDVNQNNNCLNPVSVAMQTTETVCDFSKDNILNLDTTEFSNIPNFMDVNFCGSKNGYLNSTSILLSDRNSADDWVHVSELDNRFPRGKDDKTPEIGNTHIHSAICTNAALNDDIGEKEYVRLNGLSRTIAQQTEPPYYTLNFLTNPNGGVIPSDSIMMTTTVPPLGWDEYTEIEDRLVRGSSTDFASVGGSDVHYHIPNMDISVEKSSRNKLANIKTEEVCLFDYLESESNSSDASILPPYITIPYAKKKSGLKGELVISLGVEESGDVLGVLQSTPTAPTSLETEGQTNPTSIDTTTPGFTAIFNHPDYQE